MGIGSLLGDLGRTVARAVAPSAEESISKMEIHLNDTVGAKDAYFRVGGAFGERLQQLHMTFQTERAAALTRLDAPVDSIQKQVLAHPELRNKIGLNSSLRDVHAEAQRLNHPLASSNGPLVQLMAREAGNEDRSLMQIKNQNIQQARVQGAAVAFGPKMQHVMPYIMPLLESKDPVQESWARGAMNLISNEVRDTVNHREGGGVRPASSSKLAIAVEINRRNKLVKLQSFAKGEKLDKSDLLKPFDTSSTYTPPDKLGIESRIQGVMRVVQLTQVAFKHISTVGNLASIPAPRLVEGMLHMSDPEFKAFLDSTNILAYTDHDFMDRAMRGGSGTTAKLTGSPTAGQIFFKSYHMPFFSFVRSKQLSYAASVGWCASHNWASQALRGSKIAIANLKEMGINPEEVIRQGGKLNEEQLRTGVFHFVNNRFFMDKTVEQALKSNSNMVMRSATMYHTFVNAQSRFLRRELTKMWEAGDYVGLAQFAGTVGVLWPAVAPMMKSVEIYGRTLNAKQAIDSAKQDYAQLGSGNIPATVREYISLMSMYASFGVYTNYIGAAHGNRLAYSLMGPTIGTPFRAGEDVFNMVTRTNSMGKYNAAPVVRDILEDTIPLAGNILAHQFVKTSAEQKIEQAKKPVRPRRPSRHREDTTWEF